MIESFEASQEALWNQNFCQPYKESEDDQGKKGDALAGQEAAISYFIDFVIMQ
jgi:hypothetical protein